MEFDIAQDGDYVLVPRQMYELMQAVMMTSLKGEVHEQIQALAAAVPDVSGNGTLKCTHSGGKKIHLIKVFRGLTGWGLKESKEFSEAEAFFDAPVDHLEYMVSKMLEVSPEAQFLIVGPDNAAKCLPPPNKETANEVETTQHPDT